MKAWSAVRLTLLVLATASFAGGCGETRSPSNIEIGTGEPTAAFNPIGERLALLLREKDAGAFAKVNAVTTQGSVDNLAGLVDKSYELAFVAGSELARATPEQKKETAPLRDYSITTFRSSHARTFPSTSSPIWCTAKISPGFT